MFNDIHPYLLIYLLGSLLVILLTFVKIVLFRIINWIIKANILTKNLRKLEKPDNNPWYLRTIISLGLLLFEAALSWINVVIVLGQILYDIVKLLRDLFTPAPEEIKVLRFPLRNNPRLSKEAVWAYATALGVKTGEALPKKHVIISTMQEVLHNNPDFNYQNALDQLDNLKVINPETISSIKNHFDTQNRIFIDDDLNDFDDE